MHITSESPLATIFRPRFPAALALASVLVSGCPGPKPPPEPPRKGPTDEAFVRELLEAWLVRRDVEAALRHVSADFFLIPALRDTEAWPAPLRALPPDERALRFAYVCEPPPPSRCGRLEDCAHSLEGRSGGFDLEAMKVDAEAVAANPELRSREGHEIVLVSFKLEGCNLGTSVMLDKEAPDERRVLTIFYIAG